MKIAYLFLVHDYPDQVKKLVRALYSDDDVFILHIDSQSDIEKFECLFQEYNNVIFLEERVKSYWGSFGLVQATLNGLKCIQAIPDIGRIVVLSGQDYPIKSLSYIKDYLSKHRHDIFIECRKVPWEVWDGGGLERFPQYSNISTIMDIYAGSQWFSIPFKIISLIFEFLETNPLFIRYYEKVHVPDESFFQTLLMNCDESQINNHIAGSNLHLISWGKQGNHPNTLTNDDLLTIINSEKLFARKFEQISSSSILTYIDKHILTY